MAPISLHGTLHFFDVGGLKTGGGNIFSKVLIMGMEEEPAPEEVVEETQVEEEEHGRDDDTATMELFMNYSAGSVAPHTMKMKGTVGQEELVVLIDSGATHNFISEEAIVRLKLPTEEVPAYTIRVGDGFEIKRNMKCSDVSMKIQELEVNETFYAFPLWEVDAVLGVEWLKSLGDVMVNWSELTMTIVVKGNLVYLRGDPSLTRAQTSFKALFGSVQKKEEPYLLEYNGLEGEEKTGDHSNYLIVGSANINRRSMDGARDSQIAMGAYQSYHLARMQQPARGQIHGLYEHLGVLDDSFLCPESEECVRILNQMADKYWDLYSSESLEHDLPGHLLRYAIGISEREITELPGREFFRDTKARVFGGKADYLPPILTT